MGQILCRMESRNSVNHSHLFFLSLDMISCNFYNVQQFLLLFMYKEIFTEVISCFKYSNGKFTECNRSLCRFIIYLFPFAWENSLRNAKSNQVQVIIQKHTWYFIKKVIWHLVFVRFFFFFVYFLHICRCLSTHQPFNYKSLFIEHIENTFISFMCLIFVFAIRERFTGEHRETKTCLVGFLWVDIVTLYSTYTVRLCQQFNCKEPIFD